MEILVAHFAIELHDHLVAVDPLAVVGETFDGLGHHRQDADHPVAIRHRAPEPWGVQHHLVGHHAVEGGGVQVGPLVDELAQSIGECFGDVPVCHGGFPALLIDPNVLAGLSSRQSLRDRMIRACAHAWERRGNPPPAGVAQPRCCGTAPYFPSCASRCISGVCGGYFGKNQPNNGYLAQFRQHTR